MKQHGLYRPEMRRRFWIAGIVVLMLTILAESLIELHTEFPIADWFGFNAVYGFMSCVAMIIIAKLLGVFIKRRDDYYDQ